MQRIIETSLQESVNSFNTHIAAASQGLHEQYAQHVTGLTTQAQQVASDIDRFATIHADLQKLEQQKLDATIQENVLAQI